jgi:hypothetical protein
MLDPPGRSSCRQAACTLAALCNFLSFAIKRRESKGMLKQRLGLLVAPGCTPRKGNDLRIGLSPIQSDKSFAAVLRPSKLAEALGYDVLMAHEHHSGAAMYSSR